MTLCHGVFTDRAISRLLPGAIVAFYDIKRLYQASNWLVKILSKNSSLYKFPLTRICHELPSNYNTEWSKTIIMVYGTGKKSNLYHCLYHIIWWSMKFRLDYKMYTCSTGKFWKLGYLTLHFEYFESSIYKQEAKS